MTKRFFYTDPLAAIWMAKHFGMKFSVVEFTGKSSGGKGDYSVRKELTLYPSPFCNKEGLATCKTYRGGELIGSTSLFRFRNEFFVHPDSLPLLEPHVGDILRLYFFTPEEDDKAGAVMTGFYAGGREAITWFRDPKDGGIDKQLHEIDDHQWRIIQRDGKAFHHPESGDA